MSKAHLIEEAILKEKFMCIYRVNETDLEITQKAVETCIENGAKLIEITYNHFGLENKSFELVENLKKKYPDIYIGYGTVLNIQEATNAYKHAADFIVAPIFDEGTMAYSKSVDLYYMPGVYTATEAVKAYNSGAKIVKLFPTGETGAGYGVALMKPLGFIKYFAVGHMTTDFFKECLEKGFVAAGISSSINSQELLDKKDYATIASKVQEYKSIAKKFQE